MKTAAGPDLGPGRYGLPDPDSQKSHFVTYSFIKAEKTADQIRAESVASVVPPPGTYTFKGMFDDSDGDDEVPIGRHNKRQSYMPPPPDAGVRFADKKNKANKQADGKPAKSNVGTKKPLTRIGHK